MLTAGEKTEFVSLIRDVLTRDTDGSEIRTPGTVAEVYAAVEYLTGREFWQAQQAQSRVSVRVKIDYLADVLPSDRVSTDNGTLQIVAVIQRKREYETWLMCEVRNA